MTEMRRVTVALPEEIDKSVLRLRLDERFARCTYSEIVRQALTCGLENLLTHQPDPAEARAGQSSA